MSLKMHGVSRSRSRIDTLISLVPCLFYDILLHVTADIVNGISQRLNMEEVECPPNTSSVTEKYNFHGILIFLMQHPLHTNDELDRGVVVIGKNMSSA